MTTRVGSLDYIAVRLRDCFDELDLNGDAYYYGGDGFRLRGLQGSRVINLTDDIIAGMAKVLGYSVDLEDAREIRHAMATFWLFAHQEDDELLNLDNRNDPRPVKAEAVQSPLDDPWVSEDEFTAFARRKAKVSGRHPAGKGCKPGGGRR